MEAMKAALTFVLKWGSLLAFTLIPIWPLLALPATVFDEGECTTGAMPRPSAQLGLSASCVKEISHLVLHPSLPVLMTVSSGAT